MIANNYSSDRRGNLNGKALGSLLGGLIGSAGYAIPGAGMIAGPLLSKLGGMAGSYVGESLMAYGGPVEVEGREALVRPNGKNLMFSGPSHENGGVGYTPQNEGEFVFSNRIGYNRDNRIATEMDTKLSFADAVKGRLKSPRDMVFKNTIGLIKADNLKALSKMAYGGNLKYALGGYPGEPQPGKLNFQTQPMSIMNPNYISPQLRGPMGYKPQWEYDRMFMDDMNQTRIDDALLQAADEAAATATPLPGQNSRKLMNFPDGTMAMVDNATGQVGLKVPSYFQPGEYKAPVKSFNVPSHSFTRPDRTIFGNLDQGLRMLSKTSKQVLPNDSVPLDPTEFNMYQQSIPTAYKSGQLPVSLTNPLTNARTEADPNVTVVPPATSNKPDKGFNLDKLAAGMKGVGLAFNAISGMMPYTREKVRGNTYTSQILDQLSRSRINNEQVQNQITSQANAARATAKDRRGANVTSAMLSNINADALGQSAMANIQQQQAQSQLRLSNAQLLTQLGEADRQTRMTVDDLNARNKGARDSFRTATASQLSQLGTSLHELSNANKQNALMSELISTKDFQLGEVIKKINSLQKTNPELYKQLIQITGPI